MNARILTLVIYAALTSACSDPSDVSERNLKAALSEYYAEKPACIAFGPTMNFPSTVTTKGNFSSAGSTYLTTEKLGLAASSTEQVIPPSGFMSDEKTTRDFILTPLGQQYYDKAAKGFCLPDLRVGEILNFSRPADAMGMRITEVEHTIELATTPEWLTNELLNNTSITVGDNRSGFRSSYVRLSDIVNGGVVTRKEVLGLTNNGWRVGGV